MSTSRYYAAPLTACDLLFCYHGFSIIETI